MVVLNRFFLPKAGASASVPPLAAHPLIFGQTAGSRVKPMSATNPTPWRGFDHEHSQTLRRAREHARRCLALPPLRPGEAERLVAEYAAKRGGFTQCPAAYLVPVQPVTFDP